jgi:hypothetical protein
MFNSMPWHTPDRQGSLELDDRSSLVRMGSLGVKPAKPVGWHRQMGTLAAVMLMSHLARPKGSDIYIPLMNEKEELWKGERITHKERRRRYVYLT